MEPFAAHSVFALNLYNSFAMANQGQNLLLSPISIFAALSMVLPGARENTLHQMLQAMHLDSSLPMEQMEAALGKMLSAALGAGTGDSELLSANRAYVDSAFHLRPEYLSALQKHFAAESLEANFQNDTDAERQRINQWVAQVTRGKIEDLLPPELVSENTRLVLANALYFKSQWRFRFESGETQDLPFEVTADSKVSVKMMERKGNWSVIRVPDLLTAVQLPFKGNSGLSMFAILPAERHQLDSMMSAMTAENWLQAGAAPTQTVKAIVRLPKARLEGGADLKDPGFLPSLGVTDLFGDGADLSGMSQDEQLSVSNVVHKAVLEWDEAGAEGAAAMAAVEVLWRAAEPPEPEWQEIFFDQPFLVVVAKDISEDPEKPERVPIFVGRVSNPN